MRRTFAVVLLLSLLVGQVRMIGALLGRYQARQQMQQQIESMSEAPGDEEAVQHLALTRAERESPASSFVQVEEREFRYRGNLYDVVRAEWQGDVWHVWAVHDRAEEQYLEVLEEATGPQEVGEDAVPTDRRPPVLRPLAPVPVAWTRLPAPQERARSFPSFSGAPPPSPALEVPHPPPWG